MERLPDPPEVTAAMGLHCSTSHEYFQTLNERKMMENIQWLMEYLDYTIKDMRKLRDRIIELEERVRILDHK